MKKFNQEEKFYRNNQGFSLVELIVVIAIMAVLVGMVGAQVIPYINNAKKSRDIQILSSYATAGVVAYSERVDSVPASTTDMTVTIVPGNASTGDTYTCSITDAQDVAAEMKHLVSKNYLTESGSLFQSKEYKGIDKIVVTFDFDNARVKVDAYKGTELRSVDDDIQAIL